MRVFIKFCVKCGARLLARFGKQTARCRHCEPGSIPPLSPAERVTLLTYGPSPTLGTSASQFIYEGKKYSTCGNERKLRDFLNSVVGVCQLQRIKFQTASLFRFREDFRRIIRQAPIPSLIWCLLYGNHDIRQLVIWLLGKIRNRRTANLIFNQGKAYGPEIRKETAKALRRMGAWRQLRQLGSGEEHPRVLAYVKERQSAAFNHRLDRFVENVRELETVDRDPNAAASETIIAPNSLDEGKPPKSEWVIGNILNRIRVFVMKGIPASVAKIRYRPRN